VLVTYKTKIAKSFNEYFSNIGPLLAKKIQKTDVSCLSFLKGDFKNSFAILDTTPHEIISISNSLTNKSSAGHDNIPLDIMKFCISYIAQPLSMIVNKLFAEGCVPTSLKIARVCPVFKTGDKSCIINYRPISILPSFSNIFEKLVYNRLSCYLEKHCILSKCQFGFRRNHSTSLAVLAMVNKISEAIDNNKFFIRVFIDLSKAFDTIDHIILINKLEHYGIRGLALSWFKSYLDNRSQFVTFNGVSSTNLNITCGVPQGSILGPILFLLYINDITSASNLLNFVLFADDTPTFIDHHNLNTLIGLLITELKLLDTWFIANKLSLNISKSNFIVFTGLRKKYDVNCIANKIKFNGQILKQTHST